jgi:hypothetical protein
MAVCRTVRRSQVIRWVVRLWTRRARRLSPLCAGPGPGQWSRWGATRSGRVGISCDSNENRARLRWGASPDEKVAADASDGWADASRGSTPRLTPGRIEPGVPTGASGGDETFVPGRPAPCGVGLRAAPAPPRTRCCWGSISRSRLASVVSYAPLLVRTPTGGRDPHPCDGFAPVPGQDHLASAREGRQEKTEGTSPVSEKKAVLPGDCEAGARTAVRRTGLPDSREARGGCAHRYCSPSHSSRFPLEIPKVRHKLCYWERRNGYHLGKARVRVGVAFLATSMPSSVR